VQRRASGPATAEFCKPVLAFLPSHTGVVPVLVLVALLQGSRVLEAVVVAVTGVLVQD
jgi:hypothetical protein